MKKLHTIFLSLLVVTLGCMSVQLQAQEVRYVSTTGDNAKDGLTWATAKKDIQEAINDLVNNHKTGEVWVAAGTYYPTETTESTTSLYYKAFKIPAGITVRGGFAGTENTASERAKQADKNFGDGTTPGDLDGEASKSGVYEHKTILCGDLYPSKKAQLTWNDIKQQFDVAFYGNSYHVVWFAMNGFNPTTGRANPLTAPAKLEGCVVEGGHANTHDVLAAHPHIGYGGGIYMVLNSFVYNCEVRNCDASRNGGGIYMDGGGIVRRTYVHDCQTLGLGTEFGYGGGICQDGGVFTSKERPCVVAQSVVTNCVGRMGGGIAIMADQAQESGKYAVVSNSTLVNNCTATIEAGGVYTYKGGGVASLTIVNNRCNGSGITQNGLVTGSSGGLYSHDAAYVANSVIWGNKCDANKDAQFASSRSSVNVTEKTKFYYNALSHVDNTSWSNILKMGVVSLSVENKASGHKESEGYPLFLKPTAEAGYLASATTDNDINWVVSSESSLCFAGIATSDLDYEGVTPAPQGISYDMQFAPFNARPTIGALISQTGNLAPAQDITYNGVGYDKAFFVSPGYVYAEDNMGNNGTDWEHPALFLGNVLDYIALHPDEFEGHSLAIFVKEGAVDNTRAWSNSRVRQTALEVPSNVAIFGSFNSHLTGQNLNMQSVVQTPTVITGQLMNEYRFNLPHLLVVKDQQNILIEGFKLSFANASSTLLGNSNTNGAAITLDNSHDIRFRNVIVSNSTADRGAAVYATHAEATFENCIFHNNESKTIDDSGIIYATDGSTLSFDHCDVLRNVGHASYLGGSGTWDVDTSDDPENPNIIPTTYPTTNHWQNSIFYGNLSQTVDDTNIDRANSDQLSEGLNALSLAAFSGTTAGVEGNHCMFDARSAQFASQFGGGCVAGGGDTGNQWQYNLQYAFIDGTGQGYPRFINPTKNCGVTQDGDQTYYGRATSFEPHNNNPVVNMASHADIHTSWGRDIVGVTRDFGGLPDIGAVENHEATHAEEGENAYTDGQKAYGEVLYVRDYRNGDGTIDTSITDRDGTSWERAINGNGDYILSGTVRLFDAVTTETIYKGYRIHAIDTNDYYLDVANSTLNRTMIGSQDQEGNTVTADMCTLFLLCDNNGNPLASTATPNQAKRLRNALTGEYLYLDYVKNNNTYTFRTSVSPNNAQATATITASGGGYTIRYTANKTNYYVGNNSTIPQKSSTVWTFKKVQETETHGTGTIIDQAYDMGTFKGLQYAVNKANIAYKEALLNNDGDVQKSKKQVWVGAGVYQRDPAKKTGTTPATPIVEMDEENCFIIQDGVDVYGAFPKTGNPGMDQRQALVSQYVHVLPERNISNVADYETILEPVTKGVASGVKRRVLGQPYKYNPDVGNNTNRGKNDGILYCGTDYVNVVWDGFTLRDGVWDSQGLNRPNRYGGAGAAIYKNVTLKNVVVTNNTTIFTGTTTTQDFRAGGIYMDGGTLDAGYVINNTLQGWNNNARGQYGAAYGGGMYIFTGTVFNSVVANNQIYASYADGAAVFIENANFFNNTIVNNKAEGTQRWAAGIAVWTDPNKGYASALNIYNTICVNNDGHKENSDSKQSPAGNNNVAIQNGGYVNLYNCITEDITNHDKTRNGIKAVIQYHNSSAETTPANIFESLGAYGDDFRSINLRLKANAASAINMGNDAPVIGGAVYNLIDYNDMDFAERVQDCNIDIGAYEFNGATGIAPHMIDAAGQTTADMAQAQQLVFYVTPGGYGTTNAHDPENAACSEKLQRVLDAAGRYKYLNPGKQVIVKVANSYDFLHPNNGALSPGDDGYVEPTNFTYYATRTTDWTNQDVRVWSIIVPRGVEVWGGYTDVPVDANWEKTSGAWSNTNNGFTLSDGVTDHRNITKNPTYFDSYYLNKLEKTDAHTYHVVSFTDRIFDLNGYAYTPADFEGKNDAEIREILTKGSASKFLQLLDNDESHFVHMSEDIGGLKGVTGNIILEGTAPKNFGTAETPRYASNRAVIDGIFVSGGRADAPTNSTNTIVNINSYGGAALVNDFAYVRNCILTGNTAINGGALALTDNALVSGCLIVDNEAHNQGGGIYVFEEGAKLSDGTTIESMASVGQTMDQNMAHVLTSTIVRNKAQQGGGVWYTENFEANARFNSVAIWQNEAVDQPNVYGMINPEQPTDDETIAEIYYPFSYSLIQNMRASGTNNISAEALNRQGVRFVKATSDVGQSTVDQLDMAEEQTELGHDKFEQFEYYGLTNYSTMCSTGMSKSMYEQLRAAIAISDVDLLGTPRTVDNSLFVEIGARALPKVFPNKQLMLRLFVANPEDVDTEVAGRFMRLASTAGAGTKEEYYAQEGSSFAYPFNFLQDALDYVKAARNGEIIKNNDDTPNYDAQNLPFEIIVGKGYYYPRKDLNGETRSVWAHSFAIPEGVTIVGGFNPEGGEGTYYGRYNQANATINTTPASESNGAPTLSIYNNVSPIPTGTQRATEAGQREIGRGYKSGNEDVELPAVGTSGQPGYMGAQRVTFQQWDIQDICDRRAMFDNNKNGIIEPWEFKHQTIISGNAVNGETDGVYHVMTAVADADAVGNLPAAGYLYDQSFTEDGYHCHEYGQQIRLNGLIITGGNALTYLSTALDEYGKYIYYQGAGLQVDGNRYKAAIDAPSAQHTEPVFHNSAAYGVGYRDIPISIINCQFRNNVAGYGGAISTNGTLDTYATSFEQNLAIAQTETPKASDDWFTMVSGSKQTVNKVMYPGQGGAILATGQLSCYNTLFANNEARLGDGEKQTIERVTHPTFRVPNGGTNSIRAAGGAVMIGSAGRYHMMNCDFVRNKANAYPVIFTMNPNSTEDEKGEHETTSTENYNQIVSTAVWGNEVNPDMLNLFKDNTYYQFASRMMVNVGKKDRGGASEYPNYDPTFAEGNVPSSQADLDANWKEFVWFSAYEDGVGFTQKNTYDLRDHIIFKTGQFVNWNIRNAAKVVNPSLPDDYFQNCNIQIVADNNDVAGPNFGNPSYRAGYDGFMEGADWSPTRFNRLTDNGSGWIKQTVTQTADDFVVTFDTPDPAHKNDYYQGGYPVAHYDTYPEYKLWLAIGNEKYMQATNDTEVDEIFINNTSLGHPNKNYPRISPDPTMGVTRAYIDIGVYEYQKQPLLKPGSEVDILWVSTKEHPENGPADGSTWRKPTSDLQRAINTLLSSRNGHKKEIRIMEGEYTPVTPQTVGSKKYHAFVIDTERMNATSITPSSFNDDHNNDLFYAQSLTIKGGYSSELMYEYDPAQYKTVIRQNNTNDGASTDYLLYIADPTLRYAYGESSPGVSGYNDSNKQGATYGTDPATESATARTMPIQVDGVTLINDRATAGTKGSTIYYPDYPEETAPATTITEAHSISVGGEVVYYETKEEMDKVDSDGVTHIGETVDYETEFALITETNAETISNPAKLVITKTQVVGSGAPAGDVPAAASAVYIGQNGGSALIYNTVFHSNYGMPLDAWNTVNVNNTFGLNAGKVRLQDIGGVTVTSAIHNSALWRNNGGEEQFSMPGVTVTNGNTGAACTSFTYNSFTGGNTNLVAESDVADNLHNTGLTDTNSDLASGPNFVNPENADIEARNFDIKPSVRLLNKGMDTSLEAIGDSDTNQGNYYKLIVKNKYDFSLASTTDRDALYRNRLNMARIDVGAYEFQGSLLNPLYVDPNKSHNDAATGENWDEAFGYGDLQNAVDLAAIYHMNTPSEEAYVFVKGASATNKDLHTNESLTIRDGVTVYGSIISSYSDWHGMKDAGGVNSKYNDIPNYIEDMTSIREGVASNGASKTVVSSISTAENSRFDAQSGTTPALVDGFVVSPADPAQQPTAPVINVTNSSENAAIGLRNIIVADNDLSGAPDAAGADIDVAQVSNGLIYEVLMRDNKPKGAGAVLRMSDRGYAVNVTVEGKTIGADGSQPVDGNAGFDAEKAAHIINSITNSVTPTAPSIPHAAGGERPYGNITNKHISGYFYNIADPNLNYQLTETSKYIDQCEVNEAAAGQHPDFLPGNLQQFVTYRTDRDILGNPRVLASVTDQGKVDRGAFETWKVLNSAKKFVCGDQGTIAANGTYADSKYGLIKKHYYPHDGSVCYIMEGHDLVIDPVDEHEVKPTPHNPGYMLVQEGASFFGNGRPATCAYVAVERKVGRGGSIVSMPYDMDYYADANIPSYDESGYLTFLRPYAIEDVMDYNGSMRSDWQYKIQSSDSPCWMHNEDDVILANKGVYIQPAVEAYFAEEEKQKTYRFTAKGTGIDDYVYVENGPVKTVTLTQYDDRESTGGAADFTKPEDMGWNCVGLPYLVSNYQSYDWVNPTNPLAACAGTQLTDRRRMHIPHQMWLWYDGTKDAKGNTNLSRGGYYSVNSWDATSWATQEGEAAIWVGEGIFLQTASNTGTETVQFYLPDYKTLTSSTRRQMRLRLTDAVEEDNLTPLAPAPRTRKVTVKAGLLSLAPSEGASAIEVYDTQGHQLYTTDHKTLITLPNGVYTLRERD
ncbi:MAG: hypothetical protein MJZ40_01655 [Bacteroidaceae bacterium]|nr:hypothetical protein [Bacteroidaceae bacterium]